MSVSGSGRVCFALQNMGGCGLAEVGGITGVHGRGGVAAVFLAQRACSVQRADGGDLLHHEVLSAGCHALASVSGTAVLCMQAAYFSPQDGYT